MRNQLDILSRHFDEVALPAQGRYVNEPAVTDESGVVFLPHNQATIPTSFKIMAASMILLSVGFLIYRQAKKQLA
jgi:hypothetical protein